MRSTHHESSIYCSFYLLSFSALISTNRVNATLCFLAELYIIKQVYNLYILNEKRRKISPQFNVQLTLVLCTLKIWSRVSTVQFQLTNGFVEAKKKFETF